MIGIFKLINEWETSMFRIYEVEDKTRGRSFEVYRKGIDATYLGDLDLYGPDNYPDHITERLNEGQCPYRDRWKREVGLYYHPGGDTGSVWKNRKGTHEFNPFIPSTHRLQLKSKVAALRNKHLYEFNKMFSDRRYRDPVENFLRHYINYYGTATDPVSIEEFFYPKLERFQEEHWS